MKTIKQLEIELFDWLDEHDKGMRSEIKIILSTQIAVFVYLYESMMKKDIK